MIVLVIDYFFPKDNISYLNVEKKPLKMVNNLLNSPSPASKTTKSVKAKAK